MDKYARLKDLVLGIEDDFAKFYAKNNKAAGTRARKAMQEIKTLAQDIRKEIQDKKNDEE
ncbi:MAG: histone H1 [Bacteroidia bacterium]